MPKIEYIELSKLTLLKDNPNKIESEEYEQLKKSITRDSKFLEYKPLLVFPDGDQLVIYAGNQRFKAAQELGWETIPVIIDDVTELEIIKDRIIIDNIRFGKTDVEVLKSKYDIEHLKKLDLPGLNEALLLSNTEKLLPTEGQDEVPELEKGPFVVRDDIFEIKTADNIYRIGCLDSTSQDDLKKLFGEYNIDLVFTDPPYGVDITKTKKSSSGVLGSLPEIKGDQDTSAAREFYNACQSLEIKNYIIWGGNYFTDFLPPSRCWIVWDKKVPDGMSFARGELAWVSMDKNLMIYEQSWNGNIMGKVDIIAEGLESKITNGVSSVIRVHLTQKPVGLQLRILDDFDNNFKNIFDGFSGGGTTLLTGIQSNKNVFAAEITEYYTQVSVKRCVDFLVKNNIEFEITLNNEKLDINKL